MELKRFSKTLTLLTLGALLSNEIAFGKVKNVPRGKQTSKVISQSYYKPELLTSRYASWGISPKVPASINLKDAWKVFRKKSDVLIAVIDTGIDPDHKFLKNNLYTLSGKASNNDYGRDFSFKAKEMRRPYDSHGHGTHVSGIIKSVFPDVKILTLKYFNQQASGQFNLKSTIHALKYAVDMNVDIINYSGGGPEPDEDELKILKEAERKGILIVAAAGNEQSNIDEKSKAYYPASYGLKNIISVTAHNQLLQKLESSNYGVKSVDISAPGYRIKSAFPNASRSGYLTGTSQATAFVTGVAGLLKSNYPQLKAKDIKKIINKSAKKIPSTEETFKTICSSGGILDATSAMNFAREQVSTLAKNSPKKLNKNAKRSLAHKKEFKKKVGKIIYRFKK